MKKIGFIGVGIMGKSMVRNLMKAGYDVSIYTRTKNKVEDVIEEGANWCDTVADCAKGKEAIITIVGYPSDVEQVYFGTDGILENADKGTYIMDMTTNSPKLAEKIYNEAKEKGLFSLDAPVTGGDIGAKNGTLTILVGGDEKDFTACLPVFEAMGKNIVYQGKTGSGQHAKMANQIAIAGAMAGVCEAFDYAEKVGLDKQVVFDAISAGAAGSASMSLYGPRLFKEDYNPGFFVKHFIKDMKIAKEESIAAGMDLEILVHVLKMYEKLENEGKGDLGTQALMLYYKEK